jgi:DNA segregation ATPase FtsK/SpoIIIE, S-DNA-T family
MGEIKNTYKKKEAIEEGSEPAKRSKEKPVKEVTKNKSVGGVFDFLKNERLHKVVGTFCLLFGVYLFVAIVSYLFTWKMDNSVIDGQGIGFVFSGDEVEVQNWLGKMGAFTAHKFLKLWFGLSSVLFAFISFQIGVLVLFKIKLLDLVRTLKFSAVFVVWTSMFLAFVSPEPYDFLGGMFGEQIIAWCTATFGFVGALLFVLFTGFIGVIVLFNPSFEGLKTWLDSRKKEHKSDEFLDESETIPVNTIKRNEIIKDKEAEEIEFPLQNEEILKREDLVLEDDLEEEEPQEVLTEEFENSFSNSMDDDFEVEVPQEEAMESVDADEKSQELSDELVEKYGHFDPSLELSSYKLPSIDLLVDYGGGGISLNKEELEANKNTIVETLQHYKIEIAKIKATIGPTVTLYEIVPAPGVRISKIKNLEDDIALSLAALGIRIIAPMPGKGTIGIEVPNSSPDVVSMRSLIASEKFQNSKMDLPIALGKTISNETMVVDLTKMPHLLMAGATGQGKSVGLNAILVSILYKKHPSEVKFVLVDPKKVELTLFNKIERHFLAKLPGEADAIITDTSKVVATLNSLCIEMDNRYELLKDAMVRNLKEYNQKFVNRKLNPENGHRFLPYIVLVIDEFADLIMTAGKEVETPIARLAQLARAIGIHLIVATQRPSVNVITGIIKANFPSRIAFRVTSKIDSRTILDAGGADQLIGRGDMLYSPGNELIRLQCGFVDTPEVDEITEFIGSQRAYPTAYELPEPEMDEAGSAKELEDGLDGLFEEAAKVVVTQQQGSASNIQRKLKIGYNRAGRIIDQMEAVGLIGPHQGSKAREVYVNDMIGLEQFLSNLRDKGLLQ